MAPLVLRIRFGARATTLDGVPEGCTVEGLRELIAVETGVPAARQLLKVGVPPAPITAVGGSPAVLAGATLAEVGCRNRDTIVVEDLDSSAQPPRSGASPCTASAAAAGSGTSNSAASSAPASMTGGARKRPQQQPQQQDVPESDLLPAFDRAIAAAERHARLLPEDKHQVFALRKGKAAVLESLRRGDDISLGALHTLPRVGHWVVQQVREQLEDPGVDGGGGAATKRRRSATAPPAPTPASFTWWYVAKNGEAVDCRNDAEVKGPPGQEQFRVCILHSSGRMEKAFLPDAKAPPRCPGKGGD